MDNQEKIQSGISAMTIIIAVLLTAIVAGGGYFIWYTVTKDQKREECVKSLQSKYEDNLWLQNKIQAECNTK